MCLSGTRSLEQRRKGKEKCVVPPSSFLSSSLRFFLPVLPWTRHELALDRSTRIRRVRTVELLGQVRFAKDCELLVTYRSMIRSEQRPMHGRDINIHEKSRQPAKRPRKIATVRGTGLIR